MEETELRALYERLEITLSENQVTKLLRLGEWLSTEAITAGGIGPNERADLLQRHIADGAAYCVMATEFPGKVLDIGSGVGLPGSVMAILWPQTEFTLLDRSMRRVDLARRMASVVDIPNVTTIQADASSYSIEHELVVMRAALKPMAAIPVMARLCTTQAILGLSRTLEAPQWATTYVLAAEALSLKTQINVVEVLDPPAWLLSMMK
jgi:16S rRNA G527 N7-methylase RsmG